MKFPALALVLTVLAAPLAAQEGMNHSDPPTDLLPLMNQFGGWFLQGAEQMPEADYAFKPTPEVRSFGELVGHLANGNFAMCAGVMGEKSPGTMDYEKASDKATLVAALRESLEYCRKAHAWGKTRHHDEVNLFGMKGSVTWALAFNISHMAEHYGNMVTYMRMKGMVPPSSQGG